VLVGSENLVAWPCKKKIILVQHNCRLRRKGLNKRRGMIFWESRICFVERKLL